MQRLLLLSMRYQYFAPNIRQDSQTAAGSIPD